jgi:hypothetical protein
MQAHFCPNTQKCMRFFERNLTLDKFENRLTAKVLSWKPNLENRSFEVLS